MYHRIFTFVPPRERLRRPPLKPAPPCEEPRRWPWKPAPPKEDKELPSARKTPQEEGPVDVYAILHINPRCSHDEAKRAARERRIATHPDRFTRRGVSEAEEKRIIENAKMVGFAADIVLDLVKRREHDRSMLEWLSRVRP